MKIHATVAALTLLMLGAGCGASSSTPAATDAAPGQGLSLLSSLEVKGRAPMTGYSRTQFGSGWTDPDKNGCDTRNDVLARDLSGETFKPNTHNCVVQSGHLTEPYTGKEVTFERGVTTSGLLQIDHLVALGDAWQTGAQSWTPERREQFANDPAELLAVDGLSNSQKGDRDAATWLPVNKKFWCTYVSRQIEIKVKYQLWVKPAEKAALETVLNTC